MVTCLVRQTTLHHDLQNHSNEIAVFFDVVFFFGSTLFEFQSLYFQMKSGVMLYSHFFYLEPTINQFQ